MKNQLMSLFYSYIAGSLHVSDPQAHPQENSHSCSHNHWFLKYPYRSGRVFCMLSTYRTRDQNGTDTARTSGCVNSCVNSPEDGPVDPKHVEIRRYMNKIETVTSVGFQFLIKRNSFFYEIQPNTSKSKLLLCNI